MIPTLPLAGLNIVVTRPREQAVQLAQRIEQQGGKAFLFPLLDITAVQDSKTLRDQIARLDRFDLAIFISPNAVRYGIEAIRAANIPLSPSLPPRKLSPTRGGGELRIATVGQGSAKALRKLGVADVIAPAERFDSEGLLALPELKDVAGRRVMIFRGDGGRELLGDTLKARGASVEYATCYQRSKSEQDVKMLLDAKPDAITVTSSEALGNLREMLDVNGWDTLREKPIFVPHQRIAELAIRQGWQHVQLTGAGDDGMLSALIAWARQTTEDRGLRTED